MRTASSRRCRTTCARHWRPSRRRSRSLLSTTSTWTADDEREFLATIDEEADRLNRLVGNLLDMSRLQSGAVQISTRPVGLEEVVAAALAQPHATAPSRGRSTSPRRCRPSRPTPRCWSGRVANVVVNASCGRQTVRRCGSRPRSRGRGVDAARHRPGSGHRARRRARCSSRSSASATPSGAGVGSGSGRRARLRHGMGGDDQPRRHARRRAHGHVSHLSRSGACVVTRVLVVDDEPRSAARSASTCGPAATRSTWRQRARRRSQQAAARHPDVVLLDLGLPGIDGIEVVRGSAGVDAGADHRLVGARDRGRQGRRARRRRRRLRHQAVRHGRAAGPAAGRAAPRRRRRRRGAASSRPATSRSISPPSRRSSTARRSTSPRPSGACSSVLVRHPGRLVTQRQLLQTGVGPAVRDERPTICACTWRNCAASSNPIPARPRYFITEPGMGYRFSPTPDDA